MRDEVEELKFGKKVAKLNKIIITAITIATTTAIIVITIP